MSDDARFTLQEARLELQKRECARNGHDFDILHRMGEPFRMVCPCGRSWSVTAVDLPPAVDR